MRGTEKRGQMRKKFLCLRQRVWPVPTPVKKMVGSKGTRTEQRRYPITNSPWGLQNCLEYILFKSQIQDILGLRGGALLANSKTTCGKAILSCLPHGDSVLGTLLCFPHSVKHKSEKGIARPQILIQKGEGKYTHWPYLPQWCQTFLMIIFLWPHSAASTTRRDLLAPPPARGSQSFLPPSLKPAMLGETLPPQELFRSFLAQDLLQLSDFKDHNYLKYVPGLHSAPMRPADFWFITSVLVSSGCYNKIP